MSAPKPRSKPELVPVSRRESRAGAQRAGGAGSSGLGRVAPRVTRTVLLGTLAVAAGLWYLLDAFGVEQDQWMGYLVTSALLVGVLVLGAWLLATLLRLLRRR